MMDLVVSNKGKGKENGAHQGVESEYLCFAFATDECHKCSFAVTLLFFVHHYLHCYCKYRQI